jgi:acyl-CoA reductase-like NAD-dependent aldehyde dehydrogenase
LRIASELDVGLIGINDASPQGVYYPVGGVKQSGYGVEGGLAGLEEYLTYCSISVKSSDGVEPLIAVSEQSR